MIMYRLFPEISPVQQLDSYGEATTDIDNIPKDLKTNHAEII